jgi:hypothetical protein
MAIKTDEEMDAELEQLLKEMQEEGEAIARGEDPFANEGDNGDDDTGAGDAGKEGEEKEEAEEGNPEDGGQDSGDAEEGENSDGEQGEQGSENQGGESDGGDSGSAGDNKEDADEGAFKPFEVDYGGTKLSIDTQEEMVALISKGLNSKEPSKPTVEQDMMKQGNVQKEQLQLLIEAMNGNTGALAKIAEMGKIDLLDVDGESSKNYESSFKLQQIDHDLDAVANSIVGNKELFGKWETLTNQADDDFVQTIMSDSQTLKSFKNHMETGLAEAVMPMAIKRAKLTGESLFDAYATVGREYADGIEKAKGDTKQTETKQEKREEKKEERQMTDREKKLREQASSGNSSKETDGEPKDDDDIWNMSDEEFQKKFG